MEGNQHSRPLPAFKRVNKWLTKPIETIDLDMTPFMNFFIIILPFLITMAVFTHISIIDFSLPPGTTENDAGKESTKDLDLSIVVTEEGFRIVGTGKKLDMIPTMAGNYQFEELKILLKAIKFEYPSQNSIVLVFSTDILYEDIITFMDICRESQFPDIGISGDIG